MTPHFSDAELACKCGCGMLPNLYFMEKVEGLRHIYNRPMPVTSAARCPTHNAKVSSTGRNGPHTTGRAIDIAVRGADALDLVRVALSLGGFTGVGVSQKGSARFIHFDDLPRKAIWSY